MLSQMNLRFPKSLIAALKNRAAAEAVPVNTLGQLYRKVVRAETVDGQALSRAELRWLFTQAQIAYRDGRGPVNRAPPAGSAEFFARPLASGVLNLDDFSDEALARALRGAPAADRRRRRAPRHGGDRRRAGRRRRPAAVPVPAYRRRDLPVDLQLAGVRRAAPPAARASARRSHPQLSGAACLAACAGERRHRSGAAEFAAAVGARHLHRARGRAAGAAGAPGGGGGAGRARRAVWGSVKP